MQQPKTTRIDCIEVLRGFAVLFVVLHHMRGNLLSLEPQSMVSQFYQFFDGSIGVDLFFVISGFVIARQLLPQLGFGDRLVTNWRRVILSFWLRRAWRLWPTAWLWLIIILLLSIFFNQTGLFGSVTTNLYATLAGVFHFANFRFHDAFGHYNYGASFVYWSLSLEEQFYLLLPLVAIIFRKLTIPLFLIIIVWHFSELRIFYLSFRVDGLLLGVMIAILSSHDFYQKLEPSKLNQAWLLKFLMTLLLLTALVMVKAPSSNLPLAYAWTTGIWVSALLVWLASYDKQYISIPNIIRPTLIWVGARSYAIYIIHVPIFFFLREWNSRFSTEPPSPLYLTLIAMFLIFVISDLNYRLLEKPLRERGKKMAVAISEKQNSQ